MKLTRPRLFALSASLLFLTLFLWKSFTTVKPDEVGVEVFFGSLNRTPQPPGLYFVPLASIEHMSTVMQSYTMAGAGTEGRADGSVAALTSDQLAVSLDLTVMFHLNDAHAVEVYRRFGTRYAEDLVHPLVRTSVRDAVSEFTAVRLVEDRGGLQTRFMQLLREQLADVLRSRGVPMSAIVIDRLGLRNLDLPASLDEAIANVQRQRQATEAAREANRTAQENATRALTEAESDARALLARTRADADAVRLKAAAQADANRALALSLTPAVLAAQRTEALRAVSVAPNTRVVFLPAPADLPRGALLPLTATP